MSQGDLCERVWLKLGGHEPVLRAPDVDLREQHPSGLELTACAGNQHICLIVPTLDTDAAVTGEIVTELL